MSEAFTPTNGDHVRDLFAAIRRAGRQEQFLEVVPAEEAHARFLHHIDCSPLPGEKVSLAAALGRVLAQDMRAPIDVPPFDRANVNGFAVRSADTVGASDTAPRALQLNGEVIVSRAFFPPSPSRRAGQAPSPPAALFRAAPTRC